VHLYPAGAQVVLRTMQRYGIVLADGGNIALTAESDRFTEHTWGEVGITPQTFFQAVPSRPVQPGDFEVLDTGPRIVETWDCVRTADVPDPADLAGRLVLPDRPGRTRVRLSWTGGGERVDVYRGGALAETIDNTGVWRGKWDGQRLTPYRVCNADSLACTDAVVPVPDRRTQNEPPPMAAPPPAPVAPPATAPTPLPRATSRTADTR
jgi:serine/threonine-protein kinase